MYLVPRCGACGAPGASPCPACHAALSPARLPPPPGPLDAWWAALVHDGPARELITNLKYRNRRDALAWLGHAMARLVTEPVEVVTWMPTTPDHLGRRGFDQARLMARVTGRHLGVPVRPLLVRTDRSHQTGRGRAERLAGPGLTARTGAAGRRVLVVDDVITTGGSMIAAGRALAARGAVWIGAVAATARAR